jgi:glycyl-tRNA synthetase beta chain
MTANLLVELFVEELPPKALKKLQESFAANLYALLSDQWLIDPVATIPSDESKPDLPPYESFASPRRLATLIRGVRAKAPEMEHQIKLMPVSVGLDAAGNATPALLKRLAALGADTAAVPGLRRAADGKNEALFYDSVAAGVPLAEGLQRALEAAMAKLPIPKVMTYQLADGWSTVNFVRPVHGLVALHGADIVPLSVLGLQAGRETQGHRFEARVSPVVVTSADSYAAQMKDEGAVIASYEERAFTIIKQLRDHAKSLNARLEVEPALLTDAETEIILGENPLIQEVTALVERPNVLVGTFEKAFLEVPQECLILTMKANQKYFPLLDAAGKLTNQFLIVSNISPDDASAVIQGNERVVRPRLADAKFFFDQDRRKTLESRVPGLDKVVYHNKLGTQGERVTRVQAIAYAIAHEMRNLQTAGLANRAALLAKADLLTDMVGEFPELQGIMGRYYAEHDGEDALVAEAIEDHYKPRFAGDELPRSEVGLCVALADKLETLVGLFSIGEKPTGEKDPFALRRHALGIIRMLMEKHLPLGLDRLLEIGAKPFMNMGPEVLQAVSLFVTERLAGLLRDQGYRASEVDAVLSLKPELLADIPKRLDAVRAFAALPESESLAAANKRVGNILKKAEGEIGMSVDNERFVEAAETQLFVALHDVDGKSLEAFRNGDYVASLQKLAALKAPVDAFFDQVMVNADDPALKANRLALLNQLHRTMNRVADLSRLAA